MGILKFFKKKEATEKEVVFEGVPDWILNKKQDLENREKEVLGQIEPIVSNFVKRLCSEIEVLAKVDITNKKEDEKLKMLVVKNRDEYLKCLSSFIEKLKVIEVKKLEETSRYLSRSLVEFQRESGVYYERATILIGKPMGDVYKNIGGFAISLNRIFEQSSNIFSNVEIVKSVENGLEEIFLVEKERSIIGSKLMKFREEQSKLTYDINKIEKSIQDKQSSIEYLKEKENREKAVAEKKRVESELSNLKKTIDFKSLKNTYHANDKKMKIIKDYEGDFSLILYKEDIFELLESGKIEFLKNKIMEIKIKIKDIQRLESQNDSFAPLILDKGSRVLSLKNVEKEIEANEREFKKLDDRINQLKELMLKNMRLCD